MANKNDAEPSKHTFSLLPKIVNGGIAGIIGVTVVFPLDLVKTRLQTQVVAPDGTKPYRNMLDCFIKTYKAEGYFGMYKGSAINIILITPEKAIKLAGNDFFRFHYRAKDGSLSVPRQMAAGGCAGACQIVVTTPMELLKIRMQMSGKAAADAKAAGTSYTQLSTVSLITNLLKEKGIFGFYKGIGATATRDIFFSILYFPGFATLNELGPGGKIPGSQPFWWTFMSGIVAGCCSAWLSTPLDVIKTRLQSESKEYKGYFDCLFKTFSREGITAFFKGGACRIIVIAPLFGIAQTVYFLGIAEKLLGYPKI